MADQDRILPGLGATSGASEGNVRALIALGAMLFIHVLLLLLVALYRPSYQQWTGTIITAVLTIDSAAIMSYVTKRNSEGA